MEHKIYNPSATDQPPDTDSQSLIEGTLSAVLVWPYSGFRPRKSCSLNHTIVGCVDGQQIYLGKDRLGKDPEMTTWTMSAVAAYVNYC